MSPAEQTDELGLAQLWSPRAQWSELPLAVRTGIEDLLGSRVIEAVNQHGGFSPGLAARVRCADGQRAFVKAVGPELNADTPKLHRAEARVAAALPADAPAPVLRGVYDDGAWVGLVFDEVIGRSPSTPWVVDELSRVVGSIEMLGTTLTPCPSDDVPAIADQLRHDFHAYRRLEADTPADLGAWELRHLDALAELATEALEHVAGDTLVHLDVRADNVLLGDGNAVYFVDWPWAARGAHWIDLTLFLVSAAVDGHDPEAYLAASPLAREVDPWHVTGFLAGVGGMLSEGCRRPPPPGLPGIREFQRLHRDAALSWIRRRTSWY